MKNQGMREALVDASTKNKEINLTVGNDDYESCSEEYEEEDSNTYIS